MFPHAFATGGDWQAICAGLLDRLGTLPAGAALGFVYASDALADQLGALVAGLRIKTGVRHWVGSRAAASAARASRATTGRRLRSWSRTWIPSGSG
jgi:hypothetical protein